MKRSPTGLVVLLAGMVSCARHEPSSNEPGPAPSVASVQLPTSLRADVASMDAAAARGALADATRALDETLALGAPDCVLAGQLRDRICELSARLCHLAEQASAAADTKASCQDGVSRCERARERVLSRCP